MSSSLSRRLARLEQRVPSGPAICPEHRRARLSDDFAPRPGDWRKALLPFSPDPDDQAEYRERLAKDREPCPRCGWVDDTIIEVRAVDWRAGLPVIPVARYPEGVDAC